jgi:alkylation response protein AidB-like acyl-CoA dehydrogenase
MGSDFAELHDELRAVARELLGAADPESGVEWSLLAASGWLGLEVPEACDGAGATFAEVAVVLEEMGRTASRSAYLGSTVLGVGALVLVEAGPERDRLLRDAVAGEAVPVLALPGEDEAASAGAWEAPFRIERPDGRVIVHGRAEFVPDGAEADRLLLPARDADGRPVVVCLAAGAAGVTPTAQPVLDATRRLAVVSADGVEVDEAAVWGFAGDPEAAVVRLRDRAAVAVACDSLGLSEAMLDATVAYATVRQQFGRAIGSFQAVKHACADMQVQISVARELVAAAVDALAGTDPFASSDADCSVAASMAASFTCAAAVDVVGKAMQLHGGIGYTWESGIHVYLKRAVLNRSLFGSPAAHRRRLAARHL